MLLSVTPFVKKMDENKKNIFKLNISQTPMVIDPNAYRLTSTLFIVQGFLHQSMTHCSPYLVALYRSYAGTNTRAKGGLLASPIVESSAWTDHDFLPYSGASSSMERVPFPSALPTLIKRRFGGRFTRQSPCVPGTFQHEKSRCCPSSNAQINRAGNQPGKARELTRLQSRWRTGIELPQSCSFR